MTLMSMLSGEGPETFKLGVAVAPVSDWRLYDTIYTERYMSTPQNNPLGYKKGAPTHYAHRLRKNQKLLIMHGDFDDNVHFQNTVQMINALHVANKQFDLMMYPGKNHSITGGHIRLNLFTKATDYIKANL
jgi:dipeptidyl-peptidase-4